MTGLWTQLRVSSVERPKHLVTQRQTTDVSQDGRYTVTLTPPYGNNIYWHSFLVVFFFMNLNLSTNLLTVQCLVFDWRHVNTDVEADWLI